MMRRLRMRFRSLRWRLTAVIVGLLSILLLLGGVGQYFAAREVLFRSNAEVLTSEYAAVLQAFRKQVATRPAGVSPIRVLLSQQFATELRSRRISAAIFDLNGGRIADAPATLGSGNSPTLRTGDYLAAVRSKPQPYYVATALDGTPYLAVLNVIRNGLKPVGLAQLAISTDDIEQTLRLDREAAIIGSLTVLVLALLLSPLIVRRALRPLGLMSASAAALAAGDYKQRVSVPASHDEVGALAAAFNQMAAGIDQAFEVRRHSEEQMRQFVGDASHELRTPLTSIAGYLDILGRRPVVEAPLLQTSLAAMRQETSRMTRLINDLLTLTRFESRPADNRRVLAVDQWLAETLDELNLADRGARESRAFEPGLTIEGDSDALKQVVANLAQNAVKYAPGAEQCWTVSKESGTAVIRVQDKGPGIPPEDLPHVFERFYRGTKARERSSGGSGLGLAIAKSIVDAHGGQIEATSAPGAGATFTIRLPLAQGA